MRDFPIADGSFTVCSILAGMEAAAVSSGNIKAWKGLSLTFVFWPAAIWSAGATVAVTAALNGCKIRALRPEECILFGADIGGLIYLFGHWVFSFFRCHLGGRRVLIVQLLHSASQKFR